MPYILRGATQRRWYIDDPLNCFTENKALATEFPTIADAYAALDRDLLNRRLFTPVRIPMNQYKQITTKHPNSSRRAQRAQWLRDAQALIEDREAAARFATEYGEYRREMLSKRGR